MSETCNVAETFSKLYHLENDFEIISIPGYTSGATTFLWNTGRHRCRFTGCTIFFPRGRWVAAVLDGVSDRERYIERLELIRALDFDLIVPGIAAAGQPYYALVEKPEAERHISAILERMCRGESG